jgi:hypothetical protein
VKNPLKLWHLPIAYAAVAVVTFGHSAAHREPIEQLEQAKCEARIAAGLEGYCFDNSTESAGMNGFVAALVWPLYWSWEAWS